MKVLYIGHYRDGSGWAVAAQNYILALDHAGVDVVCRPVKLNEYQAPLSERLIELEQKSSTGCDVVIQNVLPHLMDYHGGMYNIGLPFIESTIRGTPWITHLDTMDEVWVTNHSSMENLHDSGINAKIIGMPLDPYDYKLIEEAELPVDGNYVFYTVGEMGRRKNFVALIKAFHMAFHPSEPVSLVIKTNKYGMSDKDVGEQMKNTCILVREQLKLHDNTDKYAHEIIVNNHISYPKLLGLHSTADCYVNTSFGEGCCLPAWDAVMMGNPLIVPDYLYDDFPYDSVSSYETRKEPCTGATDTFPYLFTARDWWNGSEIHSLVLAMQGVYADRDKFKKKAAKTKGLIDYDKQCQGLKELLNG